MQGYDSCVSILDVFEDEIFVYLVMELCTGGSLTEYVTRVPSYNEKDARNLFKELLEVVDHCHQLGIIHRDIKVRVRGPALEFDTLQTDNFLMSSSGDGARIKCTDFGTSVFCTKVLTLSQTTRRS